MRRITLKKKEFKVKKQLIDQYNSLLDKYSQRSNYKTSLMEPATFNLINKETTKHYQS